MKLSLAELEILDEALITRAEENRLGGIWWHDRKNQKGKSYVEIAFKLLARVRKKMAKERLKIFKRSKNTN